MQFGLPDRIFQVQYSWLATKLKSILGDFKIAPNTELMIKPEEGSLPTFLMKERERDNSWEANCDGPSDPGPPCSSPSATDSTDEEVKAITGQSDDTEGRDVVTEKEIQDAVKSIQ